MARQVQLKPKYVTDETGERQMVLLDLTDYNLLLELAFHRLSDDTALASEAALARIWDHPAEDAAWRDL